MRAGETDARAPGDGRQYGGPARGKGVGRWSADMLGEREAVAFAPGVVAIAFRRARMKWGGGDAHAAASRWLCLWRASAKVAARRAARPEIALTGSALAPQRKRPST